MIGAALIKAARARKDDCWRGGDAVPNNEWNWFAGRAQKKLKVQRPSQNQSKEHVQAGNWFLMLSLPEQNQSPPKCFISHHLSVSRCRRVAPFPPSPPTGPRPKARRQATCQARPWHRRRRPRPAGQGPRQAPGPPAPGQGGGPPRPRRVDGPLRPARGPRVGGGRAWANQRCRRRCGTPAQKTAACGISMWDG